ncbi:MAG: oxalurate catabolism protein HpxZ [Noviherbaspirillum sp.]
MVINDPAALSGLTQAFAEYEKALVGNDIATLDRLFWNSPDTLRYGVGENLYGFDAIQAFRNGRPANNLERTVTRSALTTFGSDYGVANIEFTRSNSDKIGRQSQAWVRFEDGWRVVAAHVSLMAG